MMAIAYGDVYVAQIAMGADMPHTVKVFAEAEAHDGPSLVIAYSTCIAHGIDMSTSMTHMKQAVDSGYWPLYRFDPGATARGEHPFQLDSKRPTIPLTGVRPAGGAIRDPGAHVTPSAPPRCWPRRRTT